MGQAWARGELLGNRIVVWDLEESRQLFKEGFYGKPVGIAKPKNADFAAPLILDLIESYFLARRGRLKIYQPGGEVDIQLQVIRRRCEREYVDFAEKYMVYEHLRELGYAVSSGIKFGCDFAVYEHGPGIDHAPYLVQVVKPHEKVTAPSVVLAGRLATTVRKQFIMAIADKRNRKLSFLAFDWWRA